MFNKLKELKDLRDQGKKMKEMLDEIVVVGQGSRGQVMVTLNGSHDVLGVQIDDAVERAAIAVGVKEAFADANKKLQTELMKKMKDMGGLGGIGDMMKNIGG
ncbi:YbaB/EbfC family nucleoid-associated protein [Candidatus Uhrbacteria bacterium]|nr:YbaB/EbfC family nucleoid-associated protein [Candidatus Uhrbacteria bacterium]